VPLNGLGYFSAPGRKARSFEAMLDELRKSGSRLRADLGAVSDFTSGIGENRRCG